MKMTSLSPLARRACIVGLATLMLSTLAYAAENDKDKGKGKKDPPVTAVPEANAGMVLIPIVGAMLFFTTRRLWAAKVAQPTGDRRA